MIIYVIIAGGVFLFCKFPFWEFLIFFIGTFVVADLIAKWWVNN